MVIVVLFTYLNYVNTGRYNYRRGPYYCKTLLLAEEAKSCDNVYFPP